MGVNSGNKGFIGNVPYNPSTNVIVDGRNSYLSNKSAFEYATPYVRPSEWVSLPGVTSGEQKLVGTFAVYNHDSNFVAVTVAGNYTVDWGDGTTGSFSSGAAAYKRYDTTTYSGLTSSVYKGYKTLNITITPQSGANLTSINLTTKHNQSTLSNYVNQWLDIKVSAANLTTFGLTINSDSIPMGMLEQFEWVNSSTNATFNNLLRNCYELKNVVSLPKTSITNFNNMFQNCYSIEKIPWFDTSDATAFNNSFSNCFNLKELPFLNTAKVTDFSLTFENCYQLRRIPPIDTRSATDITGIFRACLRLTEIPFLNTSNVTNFNVAFSTCLNLNSIPPLNTSKGTIFTGMFINCRALQEVPLFDTSQGTNFREMFSGCNSLRKVPAFNTANGTNFNNMFYDCYSLEEVPFLNTSKGTSFVEMFMFDYNLKSVPQFDLSNATDLSSMFRLCVSLPSVPDFNTSKCLNFISMFQQSGLMYAPGLSFAGGTAVYNTSAFANMFSVAPYPPRLIEGPNWDFSGVSAAAGYASVYSNFFTSQTSLSRVGITGIQHNFSVSGCKLSGTALNELYTSLAVVGASGSATKTITVTNNWGAATDDPNIAIAKGWAVSG
jgi:hypothetical protein